MVDLTQLTIVPGKAVWVLRADVVCMDHDGNVEDAALLSLCGALRSLQLPKPTFNERKSEVTVSPGATPFAACWSCASGRHVLTTLFT